MESIPYGPRQPPIGVRTPGEDTLLVVTSQISAQRDEGSNPMTTRGYCGRQVHPHPKRRISNLHTAAIGV
jgi:hypothetical protein